MHSSKYRPKLYSVRGEELISIMYLCFVAFYPHVKQNFIRWQHFAFKCILSDIVMTRTFNIRQVIRNTFWEPRKTYIIGKYFNMWPVCMSGGHGSLLETLKPVVSFWIFWRQTYRYCKFHSPLFSTLLLTQFHVRKNYAGLSILNMYIKEQHNILCFLSRSC
jgi:hypothetical protein